MGFSLELDPVGVRGYLAGHPNLSRGDRVRVFAGLDSLRVHGDTYRADTSLRLSAGSSRLQFNFLFRDSTGRLRHFRLVVDDSWAAAGVPRIVWADEV